MRGCVTVPSSAQARDLTSDGTNTPCGDDAQPAGYTDKKTAMSTVFLTAEWQRLVMLNFPIEAPSITEICAARNGDRCVGGHVLHQLGGISLSEYKEFEGWRYLSTEISRRLIYVSMCVLVGPEGWRRGVVFIREVVPRQAIASIARWLYNENYVACPTRSTVTDPSLETVGRAEYHWKHDGAWLSIGARFSGDASSFRKKARKKSSITEHYWGYSAQRDGGTVEYQVEHPPMESTGPHQKRRLSVI